MYNRGMPDAALPALLSVAAISLLSFVGALALTLGPARLRGMLPVLVALAAGALVGDVFLHLLPEAVEHEGGFTPRLGWWVLTGLLGFFVIESVIHWHHHGEDLAEHVEGHIHPLAWMNLLGDLLHNVIDGMLVAGAWMADPSLGLAVTIAVALHEIPQEFGDFGVLVHAGMSPARALKLNFLSAAGAVAGAVAVLLLGKAVPHVEHALVPLAAGGFLYVACADLVPELRRRVQGWGLWITLLALAAGVAVVALVPAHAHGSGHAHDHGHDHDHDRGHGPTPVPRDR
jgi:zinc and cadmium transporter